MSKVVNQANVAHAVAVFQAVRAELQREDNYAANHTDTAAAVSIYNAQMIARAIRNGGNAIDGIADALS